MYLAHFTHIEREMKQAGKERDTKGNDEDQWNRSSTVTGGRELEHYTR